MLPDLLEIVPWTLPVEALVSIPGSKSLTNRSLILAALAQGEVILEGALWSEDTQVMIDCLQQLGYFINVDLDPHEPGNRRVTVYGRGADVPRGGSPEQPLELFVGNAGTAARFLTAFLCLGQGAYRLSGVPRMHQRPQSALFQALRGLGYRIDSPNDKLPALVYGEGPKSGTSHVSIEESSQFASALILCSHVGGWKVGVIGENADESPYVNMTMQLAETFPRNGGSVYIEPDASSGSYFWAANFLHELQFGKKKSVRVAHWPASGWQIDADFPNFLPLPPMLSRRDHLGDSIMTAMVLAPFGSQPVLFRHLGRLRLQECERVHALRTELARCGIRSEEKGDDVTIFPGQMQGATIETYEDHRMAMCFATLGLHVPGIKIKNPGCVKKTFPDFFHKLAQEGPEGLSAKILDGSGKVFRTEELL